MVHFEMLANKHYKVNGEGVRMRWCCMQVLSVLKVSYHLHHLSQLQETLPHPRKKLVKRTTVRGCSRSKSHATYSPPADPIPVEVEAQQAER
ncbi:hypothetical protein E2C01_015616 [Portunus trituberculatus]|uniref:Uncharacterized protein n=1 Tax=Portunus trituberculatus TaxID=210409 RepID=A0A5B7DMD2_PORTR|nr:hypothetical protein [Portunus trituberculatus]